MTTLYEGNHTGEFLLSEANGARSRREVTFAILAAALVSGTVVGKKTKAGTATATAFVGNTGTGTVGTITVGAGAKAGDYKLLVLDPVANAGSFALEDPDGLIVGVTGDIATAFVGGGLSFTVSDATDFLAGDGFKITVAAGAGTWAAYDDDNTDGTEVAAGILYSPLTINAATQKGVIIDCDAEVASARLTGSDAAAVADLLKIGIKVRS